MGKLGHGTDLDVLRPTLVTGLQDLSSRATFITAGAYNSAAVLEDGRLYVWGAGGGGQLAQDDDCPRLAPSMVSKLGNEKISAVAFGHEHAAALTHSGAVLTWGNNEFGQLGVGVIGDTEGIQQVVALKGKTMIEIYCSDLATFCLSDQGAVFGWGSGESKQTCSANYEDMASPHQIRCAVSSVGSKGSPVKMKEPHIVGLSVSSFNCVAIDDDGDVYGWGFTLGDSPVRLSLPIGIKRKERTSPTYPPLLSCGSTQIILAQ